ncbi:MAG TPA: hypothetical protein VN918_08225 [Myxococcaceae bacterium]|nr:hypothetical protein [Myxococcaceae bacterium]
MSGLFEWLVKLLFLVMLAPLFVCLFVQLFVVTAVALLPWVIGLVTLLGLSIGFAAGLAQRLRLQSRPTTDRVPPGEVPPIRRAKGVRTER